jgi:hypothetical protein
MYKVLFVVIIPVLDALNIRYDPFYFLGLSVLSSARQ